MSLLNLNVESRLIRVGHVYGKLEQEDEAARRLV